MDLDVGPSLSLVDIGDGMGADAVRLADGDVCTIETLVLSHD